MSEERLGWATDVHLNFLSDVEIAAFAAEFKKRSATRILLSGDISESDQVEHHLQILANEVKCPIYFVLGNHDFYRGSVDNVRERCMRISERSPLVHYLHGNEPIALSDGACLVGCDGWGDARLGNVEGTQVFLSDFFLIRDLAGKSSGELRTELRRLGDESASVLGTQLALATRKFERIIVLTHVPPFKEACWHEGHISDDDWLPFFTCKAVGEVLLEYADAHPKKRFEVYCGHTHSGGEARLRPNLTASTGGAHYGAPALARMISVPSP